MCHTQVLGPHEGLSLLDEGVKEFYMRARDAYSLGLVISWLLLDFDPPNQLDWDSNRRSGAVELNIWELLDDRCEFSQGHNSGQSEQPGQLKLL
jgi:hypothetical protein